LNERNVWLERWEMNNVMLPALTASITNLFLVDRIL
ncbi:hypothetical protein L914_01834, partial [Phytophthora nicotianae]